MTARTRATRARSGWTTRKMSRPLKLERIAITVRAVKVTEWAVESVPGGGLAGLLGQLT
jgi:hypothetical protein